MSENTDNKTVSNDEIDLLDLFRRMGKTISRWLNALGRALLISIVFLLKKWLPLLISVIAGVAISFIMKTTSESLFTSDMTLRSNAGFPSELISYINRLHTFCEEDNAPALSDALSLDSEMTDNIIDISAYWVIDMGDDGIPDYIDYRNKHNVYDTVNVRMKDRLNVEVKIKIPQELSLISNSIIAFIERDSLFQQKNRVRLRQNKELLARLNYDIIQLDSLQKLKLEETKTMQPQTGGQMVFLQEQKTQLVYPDIYTLYARKQSLELTLDLYTGIVTVISDFSLPAKRDNGGLFYAKKYVPVFFILTLLILILLANREKMKEIYNKY
jgi:hypothetical protein